MTKEEQREALMYRNRAIRALDVIQAGVVPLRPDWLVSAWENREDPQFMAALRRQAETEVE